jgi:hypothetical protein
MIKIFYHMYCIGDCIDRLLNTFDKIKNSNLLYEIDSLNVNLTGEAGEQIFRELSNFTANEPKIKISNKFTDSRGEMDTIKFLWDEAQQASHEDKFLYLHGKGVSRPDNANVQAWVEYMEYFLIGKWETCLRKLDEYDTCGVNLQNNPIKHYSGNFWWANASYLKQLKKFDVQTGNYVKKIERDYCEFWLLDNNFCNPCSLFSSGVDHYAVKYEKHNYETT